MIYLKDSPSAPQDLKRQLGLASATALVAGEVIAVGIFLTPAEMSRSIGSPLLISTVWIAVGALSILGALCYGELAARFPEAGGGYVYLREAYGPRIAFLYGWKCFLVMDPGLTAALAVGVASYVGYIVSLSWVGSKLLAIGCIVAVTSANILGVRFGASIMRGLTALKVSLLLFIICWAVGFGFGSWSHFLPFVPQHSGSDGLGIALAGGLISAFFAFAGWWDVSRVTGEVSNPQKNLPRALFFGILIVTVVYLATSAVFIYLVPIERVTSGETFAAQAGEAIFGRRGGLMFSSVVIISVLGSLAAFMIAAPRLYYAMARDRLFFMSAARIHPRFGTPVGAIALQSVMASALVLLGNFRTIVAYFFFITFVFIGLTVAGLMIIRRRHGESISYKTPGYPLTPILFVACTVAFLFVLFAGNPRQALIGTAVVGLGLPVYKYISKSTSDLPAGSEVELLGADSPERN